MKINIEDGLPFVTATLTYNERQITLTRVILDTGSATSIFSADRVAEIGLHVESDDVVGRVSGVGGTEPVFEKYLSRLSVGDLSLDHLEVQIGAMQYNIDLDGIIGFDFLSEVKAVIDLAKMEVTRGAG